MLQADQRAAPGAQLGWLHHHSNQPLERRQTWAESDAIRRDWLRRLAANHQYHAANRHESTWDGWRQHQFRQQDPGESPVGAPAVDCEG